MIETEQFNSTTSTMGRRCAAWILETNVDALAVFNGFEAAFWIVVGSTVAWKSRSGWKRRLGRVAAVWFVLFGISDIFEIYTGAWWRPWPLFVLKAICVAALVTCGIIYRKLSTLASSRHKPVS